MPNEPILGELWWSRFDDGSFKFRDDSLIMYSHIERIISIVGVDIESKKNQIDALIGGSV